MKLVENSHAERAEILDNMLDIESRQFETFVTFEYSLWDEMCVFARTQDIAWARNSLDITPELYDFEAFWVLGPTGAVVYSSGSPPGPDSGATAFLGEAAGLLQTTQRVAHFFAIVSDRFIEIRAATIHSTIDNERATPPHGVFVCARVWDDSRLKKLSQSIRCSVWIAASDSNAVPVHTTRDSLIIKRPLLDSRGRILAELYIKQPIPALSTFIQDLYSFVFASLLATLATFGLLLKYIYTTMSRPLALIERSLREHTAQPVKALSHSATEFSSIAVVIEEFFDQREVLRHAKEHAELVNRVAPTGIFTVDRDRRVTSWNKRSAEITGYTSAEVIGNPCSLFMGRASLDICAHGSESCDHEFFIKHKDGTLRFIVHKGLPLRDSAGDIIGTVESIDDITERHTLEAALKHRDNLLEVAELASSILLASPVLDDAVMHVLRLIGRDVEADRVYIFENNTEPVSGTNLMSQRYEWTSDSAAPQIDNPDLQDVPYDEQYSRWWNTLSKGLFIDGHVSEFPESERTLLESQDIISLLVVPIMVHGRFWGFAGLDNCHARHQWTDSERSTLATLASNIGAAIVRHRTEQQLREVNSQLQLLRRAVEASASGIVIVDALHPDFPIIYANPAFERITGYEADEVIGHNCRFLQGNDREQPELSRLHEAIVSHQTTTVIIRNYRKNGTMFWNELSISPLHDDQDRLTHFIGVQTDITKRKLAEDTIQRAREMEVSIAAHIQQTLLIADVPGGLHNLNVYACSTASQSVDGDFYDFYSHGDQILDVIVGDVMGKGIPAALLGAATKNVLARTTQRLSESNISLPTPADIVNIVHSVVSPELINLESFVTCCFARFDCTRNMLSFVDCGHTRTIHYRHAEGVCDMLKGINVPLGFTVAEVYDQITLPYEPGDIFLFYSDGITEAQNAAGEQFGEQRLINSVYQAADAEAREIARQIFEAACAFSGRTIQRDDMTCVVVRIGESGKTHVINQAEIELSSTVDMLGPAREFLATFMADIPTFAFGNQSPFYIELALQEALANVIKHAYCGRDDGLITIQLQLFPGDLFIIICHRGTPFNPTAVTSPTFDGTRDNGFGMYIINQCIDEVHYLFGDSGRNLIVMRKKMHITNHTGETAMDLSCDTSNAIFVVGVHAEALDASNAGDFKQKLAPLLESHTNLILDLSAVKFIDSSGLGSLLTGLRALNSKGGDLKLYGLTKQVRVLFELVRMQRVFAIFNSRDEALRAFSQ